MFIEGIGISNYRSFKNLQLMGPFKKINLFVGQNNSGKSNIIQFLKRHYRVIVRSAAVGDGKMNFQDLDKHIGDSTGVYSFAFAVDLEGDNYKKFIENFRGTVGGSSISSLLDRIFRSEVITKGLNVAWLIYDGQWGSNLRMSDSFVHQVRHSGILNEYQWHDLWQVLNRDSSGGDVIKVWIPEVLSILLTHIAINVPDVELVPAIRKIGDAGSISDDYSGIGIIEKLAQLQNPSIDKLDNKKLFDKINVFVQAVVGNITANLEVPHDRKMIMVRMDNRTLPLESLGTGIHEVIIIAAAATVLQNQILCVEEPELHLHPLLQKKLVRYLDTQTNNQYFITTHSAHLLDIQNAAIFHVRHQEGQSKVEAVQTNSDKDYICSDLGYRASDILQANCIVWVEGPSDRIYVNHWLKAVNSGLIEGVHYAVMFYGGRLLSHLSATDEEITDFISLRRLNRYGVIIIDSDKSTSQSRINGTKLRIITEYNKEKPGFAWLTKGREIENYIDPQIMEEVIKALYPKAKSLAYTDSYNYLYHYKTNRGHVVCDIDKIKVAHKVVSYPAKLDVLDLKSKIDQLAGFIRSVNDFLE